MGRGDENAGLTGASRDAVRMALADLGCSNVKWKGSAVHFDPGSGRVQLGAEVLPAWMRSLEAPIDLARVTLGLADVTGLTPPRTVLENLDAVRERLLPRLVDRSAFSGPDRAMCRREVGSDVFASIWIRAGSRGLWLTTAELDAWPVDFESCLLIARGNIGGAIGHGTLNEISDGHGVLAALAEGVDMTGAMLDLPSLLPDDFGRGGDGALVSSPNEGTALLLPVRDGIGAEGVASIVQISDMLRDPEASTEVQTRIFWARPGGGGLLGYVLEMLPVTVVVEGGSRRAHVDSSETVRTLLRLLGEEG